MPLQIPLDPVDLFLRNATTASMVFELRKDGDPAGVRIWNDSERNSDRALFKCQQSFTKYKGQVSA